MSNLATVDLPGVEILAADVTIHGRGSPPGGDRYSVGELRAIAEAHHELASELRPPAKIGHDGYGPSVGRLENLRVIGSKLVADVKDVPRRFAELIDSKAYSSRSVELSRVTSQRTGKRYPLVVSALAWLGDRLPAVRTLDDVHALYEGDVEIIRAYELDAPADTETLIEQAVEDGRIALGSVETWKRSFEMAPELAGDTLESAQPNMHRRMENRLAAVSPPWSAAEDAAYRDHCAAIGIDAKDVI